MQTSAMQVDGGAMQAFSRALLAGLGVPEPAAADVAAHLVEADRAGYPSHGVSLLPGYRDALVRGDIRAAAEPVCTRDAGSLLAFDGGMGLGQHVGKVMFDRALVRARETGICAVTLAHSHHLGRVGTYGEQVVAGGMALVAFTNVVGRAPMVAPFGGSDARLTTNPLCIAWPLPGGRPPFLLDMATSAIALNKARVLAERGEPAPAGALIDAGGRPTTDPSVMLREPQGALLPFGGHKGYGLGLATELLAGLLSGGGTVQPAHQHAGGLAANNLFAVVADPGQFTDPSWLAAEAGAFIDYLQACPPQPGGEPVQYPGEYEARQRERHLRTIELDAPTWEALTAMAGELYVALPAASPAG